jgi:hypothetical protein
MAWSYDPTNLDTSTAEGRKNTVRLLIGDTETADQQLQDEEINHALEVNNTDVYNAAVWCARTIAAKYARRVSTEIDGALRADYSDLKSHYEQLATTIDKTKKKLYPTLGSYFGGVTVAQKEQLLESDTRTQPSFYTGQWDYYNPYDGGEQE